MFLRLVQIKITSWAKCNQKGQKRNILLYIAFVWALFPYNKQSPYSFEKTTIHNAKHILGTFLMAFRQNSCHQQNYAIKFLQLNKTTIFIFAETAYNEAC